MTADSAAAAEQRIFRTAAVLGLLGVALGAFGAHLLKDSLAASGHEATWETGVRYQLLHAVALLALAACGRAGRLLAACWVAGVVLFSGSLYALSFSGPKWLGPVTPLGGVLLLAGWLILILRGR